jgi:cardiolipin synthase
MANGQAGGMPTSWTQQAVFRDGDAWYDGVLAAIAGATSSVEVESYILAPDPVGRRLEAALLAAAARGVEVRLLVDGVGSAAWVRACDVGSSAAFSVAGALAVRVWHPLPWGIVRRANLATRWRWLIRINRRDHRKLVIIDGAEAWLGSINWEVVHSARERGAEAWRDTGARVAGPGVACLRAAWEHAWARSWPLVHGRLRLRGLALPRRAPLHPAVRLNHTWRARRAAYRALLRLIRGARRRVWIANAYVVPRGSLLRALAAAARRGVEVRLLLPARSDHAVMPWIAALHAESLARAGVAAHAYRPRVLHAKTMLIDDLALVGSHNLNSRSFLHDLECEAVLSDPAVIAALERDWDLDLAESDPLPRSALAALPWWQRLAARTALLLRRWI